MKEYISKSSKFQSRSRKQFKSQKLRKYTFLMFEIKFEPVSFLVYLKPQCNALVEPLNSKSQTALIGNQSLYLFALPKST